MLDLTNAVACFVLMLLTAPVAKVMHHSNYWPQRFGFFSVVIMLGLQVVSPLYDFLPTANGLQTVFNLVMLAIVLASRSEIMAIVRISVGTPIKSEHPMRRTTDIDALSYPMIHGGGVERPHEGRPS